MLTHVTSMGHDLTRRDHNREKPIPQSPPDVYANRLAEIESRPDVAAWCERMQSQRKGK